MIDRYVVMCVTWLTIKFESDFGLFFWLLIVTVTVIITVTVTVIIIVVNVSVSVSVMLMIIWLLLLNLYDYLTLSRAPSLPLLLLATCYLLLTCLSTRLSFWLLVCLHVRLTVHLLWLSNCIWLAFVFVFWREGVFEFAEMLLLVFIFVCARNKCGWWPSPVSPSLSLSPVLPLHLSLFPLMHHTVKHYVCANVHVCIYL